MSSNRMLRRAAGATASVAAAAALVAATALTPAARSPAAPLPMPRDGVAFGVYDPDGTFASAAAVRIAHDYVHWLRFEPAAFAADAADAARHGRTLLVTVEPWTDDGWSGTDTAVMRQVAAGAHDARIDAVCGAVGAAGRPAYVRFAPEMEDQTGRYPWAGDPVGYVAGYRHFVERCRTHAPNASFVWSPIGNTGFTRYYPGDGYVDQVGLSVFGLEAWDKDQAGRPLTFAETLRPKYIKSAVYGKPIMIAELGVSGSAEYRTRWLAGMLGPQPDFPQLAAVVYFDRAETGRWPSPYGSPDWRITPEAIDAARTAAPTADAQPIAGARPAQVLASNDAVAGR